MAKVIAYQNGLKVAQTSQAYNCVITNELMRSYTLKFLVANNNPFRKYIVPGTVFEVNGQLFDIAGFQSMSGSNNWTEVSAFHVSYQLNDYIVPAGYSYYGTPAQVAQNILNTARNLDDNPASFKFSLGTVKSAPPSLFTLGNEQEVSVRSALLAMQAMGVEVDYSNYTINLPARIGADTGKVFEFGKDLLSIRRTWNKNDGTTYEVEVATLHKVPGGTPGEEYHKGDDVTIKDDLLGETYKRRIISIQENPDDPTQDKITLGVFIRDNATNAVNTKVELEKKLTEGKSYNNVRINSSEGFVSETDDGQKKVTMSGTDGFVCWVYENGQWVKKSWLDEMGLVTSKISNPNSDGTYGIIGDTYVGPFLAQGLRLFGPDGSAFFEALLTGSAAHLRKPNGPFIEMLGVSSVRYLMMGPDGSAGDPWIWLSSGSSGFTAIWYYNTSRQVTGVRFSNSGIEFEVNGSPHGHTENITISGRTLRFVNGILVSAS